MLAWATHPHRRPPGSWRIPRQAGRLASPTEAATRAAEAGLLEFGAWVRFRHPLVRSAAFRSESVRGRQDVHRALAEVTDPPLDPDRRAWHLAQATPGPDENVAAELERSAGRAQARGGLAAAAAFLERSAMPTLDPGRRAQRLVAAARAKHAAGALDAALGLLVAVEAGPPDPLRTAEVEYLLGQIASQQQRSGDGARLLPSAARRQNRSGRNARPRRPAGDRSLIRQAHSARGSARQAAVLPSLPIAQLAATASRPASGRAGAIGLPTLDRHPLARISAPARRTTGWKLPAACCARRRSLTAGAVRSPPWG